MNTRSLKSVAMTYWKRRMGDHSSVSNRQPAAFLTLKIRETTLFSIVANRRKGANTCFGSVFSGEQKPRWSDFFPSAC